MIKEKNLRNLSLISGDVKLRSFGILPEEIGLDVDGMDHVVVGCSEQKTLNECSGGGGRRAFKEARGRALSRTLCEAQIFDKFHSWKIPGFLLQKLITN